METDTKNDTGEGKLSSLRSAFIRTSDNPAKSVQSKQSTSSNPKIDNAIKSILNESSGGSSDFEEFLDEQMLVSKDALGKKEMKIKVIEISDEHPPSRWKLGDRLKAKKIVVTIKHLESMNVEEAEFDIESIEAELREKRHYSSSNRWIPVSDIKNGYVLKTRHMTLISDAVALDYIAF